MIVVIVEFYTSTDILVTFSGHINDQNVVIGRINEVVVLTGIFYQEMHRAFSRAKKIGHKNEVVVLMRWSH